jgi:ketosteroid isomerase-like protein
LPHRALVASRYRKIFAGNNAARKNSHVDLDYPMKSHSFPFGFCIAALLALFSNHAFATLSAADREALEKTHAAATAPVSMHPSTVDWTMFVDAHYAADAKLLPPNSPVVSGREALVGFFKSFPPLSVFKTTDLEIDGDGDFAYIRGEYEITMNPPNSAPVTEKGKYMEVWRKRSEIWRCVADVFNGDTPAMPPMASSK